MKISVIIPYYENMDNLRKCCNALRKQTVKPYEVIIVNDNPLVDFDQVEFLKGFKVINNPCHRGPAFSRNYGASVATGEVLFFLDSDVVLLPNAVEELQNSFSDENTNCVQGLYKLSLNKVDLATKYSRLFDEYKNRKMKDTKVIMSYCFAIKKEIFESTSGFDINIRRATVEDNDFGAQLYRRSVKILLNEKLRGFHLKRYNNLLSLLKWNFFMFCDLAKLYLRKRYSFMDSSPISIEQRLEKYRLLGSMLLAPVIFLLFLLFIFKGDSLILCYFAILLIFYFFVNINFFIFLANFLKIYEVFLCLFIDLLVNLSRVTGAVVGIITFPKYKY